MKAWRIILIVIAFFALIIALSYGFGWIGVHQTKTFKKAQQNADREVFEQTQSYVEGKRQEAVKLYKEYRLAKSPEEKEAIKSIVSHSFANFDENKLSNELRNFIYNCKYK
jgi:type II secretory pathway component PulL